MIDWCHVNAPSDHLAAYHLRILLNRVIDSCRAVPDAFVPAGLLISEPVITGSLELVMQSVGHESVGISH